MTNNVSSENAIRPTGSIADDYCDLLSQLDDGKRRGMIHRLSVGYYEGWQPSREELSALVDFELGRISEAEFFATKQPNGPDLYSVRTTPGVNRINHLTTTEPARSADLDRRTVFNVDCGELAGRFRFVANRLRSAGWTVREEVNYRMIFLDYQLVPLIPADREPIAARRPIAFDAPILCVPDLPAPWSADDGRSIRHIAGPQGISGSRGPWPLANGVRLIKFVISRQLAPGSRSTGSPAGVLLVDMTGGRAAWKPVGARRSHQGGQN